MAESKNQQPESTNRQRWAQDDTRAWQARLGLQLTYEERLEWLERTVEEMRSLQGLAKKGKVIGDLPGQS